MLSFVKYNIVYAFLLHKRAKQIRYFKTSSVNIHHYRGYHKILNVLIHNWVCLYMLPITFFGVSENQICEECRKFLNAIKLEAHIISEIFKTSFFAMSTLRMHNFGIMISCRLSDIV